MTRHILTTATLVAFLAAGQAPLTAASRRDPDPVATNAPITAPAVEVVELEHHLVAVHVAATPAADRLDVALQLEPDHAAAGIGLWVGRKNGWGASPVLARPEAGLAGFLRAEVLLPTRPTADDRLWLALERPGLRPAIAGLALLHRL